MIARRDTVVSSLRAALPEELHADVSRWVCEDAAEARADLRTLARAVRRWRAACARSPGAANFPP